MSRAWAGGSTWASRKIRRLILVRDGDRCQIALPGTWTTKTGDIAHCLTYADQVHHKLGKGVSERFEDLEAACGPCNSKVGDPRTTDPQPEPRTQW